MACSILFETPPLRRPLLSAFVTCSGWCVRNSAGAQYPRNLPPTVQITTVYPGAFRGYACAHRGDAA